MGLVYDDATDVFVEGDSAFAFDEDTGLFIPGAVFTLNPASTNRDPLNPNVNIASRGFGALAELYEGNGAGGTFAWASANKPIAVPFYLFEGDTLNIAQLATQNGTGTMTDSFDIGIYTTSWARLVSTGSTARAGVSSLQVVNVADTVLTGPGKWYAVMSNNGTTANQQRGGNVAVALGVVLGLYDSATNAFPLPDPLTNMVPQATFTQVPWIGMSSRSLW